MKLKSLVLNNFRTFGKKTEFGFTCLNFFVGPNASGKSNVIEAIRLLKDLYNRSLPRDFRALVFDREISKNIEIGVEFELSLDDRKNIVDLLWRVKDVFTDINYDEEHIFKFIKYDLVLDKVGRNSEKLSVSNTDGGYVTILEHLTDPSGIGTSHFIELENYFGAKKIRNLDANWKKNTGEFDKSVGILTRGNGTVAYKIGDMIAEFLYSSKIMSTNLSPKVLLGSKEESELTPTAENLVTVLNTLINVYPDEYPEILEQFRKLIGDKKALLIAPPVQNNITAQIGESGLNTKTDFANFSKGLERLVILLLVFRGIRRNTIVCIEEPETHLHARAQKVLMSFFEKNSKNYQLFVTTHSPIFTKLGNDSSTHLIDKIEGVSEALQINSLEDMTAVRCSLGVANSDIYLPDGILYLEGPNDLKSFSRMANSLGFEDIDKKIIVKNLGGKGNSKKLKFLARYFKKSNTKFYAILDNHKENVELKSELLRERIVNEEDILIRDKQFEDLFESELIIKCMKEIADANGFNFDLTEQQLDNNRHNEEIVRILGHYVANIKDYKTTLAEKLTTYTIDKLSKIGIPDEKSISSFNDFIKENFAIMKRIKAN